MEATSNQWMQATEVASMVWMSSCWKNLKAVLSALWGFLCFAGQLSRGMPWRTAGHGKCQKSNSLDIQLEKQAEALNKYMGMGQYLLIPFLGNEHP